MSSGMPAGVSGGSVMRFPPAISLFRPANNSPEGQEIILADFSHVRFNCVTLRDKFGVQGSGKITEIKTWVGQILHKLDANAYDFTAVRLRN